jgi:hypothetical protein
MGVIYGVRPISKQSVEPTRSPKKTSFNRCSVVSVHDLGCELAPAADLWTVEDKNPRYDGQQGSNTTEQAGGPAEGEPVVHLARHEGEGPACSIVSDLMV